LQRAGDAKVNQVAEQHKQLKITLVKSTIGFNRKQGEVVTGLGLRRIRHSVTLPDTPSTRGMVHKVRHLVTVEQI
jgi:large subunit ribosomal protein L30